MIGNRDDHVQLVSPQKGVTGTGREYSAKIFIVRNTIDGIQARIHDNTFYCTSAETVKEKEKFIVLFNFLDFFADVSL
ncbi:hypothetical protein CSA57_02030 [candidate division KSB3 bacterium]|nr:MAG: hypothetical protein CSA57_02030 [candidate division KSB3 bacterium]